MREIKFRAWNTAGRKMHPCSQWAYEWPMIKEQHESGLIVIQQYTGLKDKNGVDIYEGDIVESIGEIDCTFGVRPVIFKGGSFTVEGYGLVASFVEVIGNIYENPDLLP